MKVNSNLLAGSFLEILPFNKIAKYPDGPPKNAAAFTGYPRQHPTDTSKIILVYDPLGQNTALLEFNTDDVLYVEELHSAVTQNGEGVPLVKIWIRRGSHGMVLEPYEVNESVEFVEVSRELRSRFIKPE